MRIRYIIPIETDLIVSDHWEIPMQGGTCRVLEENGRAKALEIVFSGQPIAAAPDIQRTNEESVDASITVRDQRIEFVRRQLDDAITYLRCYFEIDVNTEEIDARYEAETPDEDEDIAVKSLNIGKHRTPLTLPFDMFTRALMVSENAHSPKFEATLASTARRALYEQQFINSFRYSFLLIESLYGGGMFKSASLKRTLKGNEEFVTFLSAAIKNRLKPKPEHKSATAELLSGEPTTEDVIDHLVDMRGLYFHGNVKRKDNWRPENQDAAEALALLSIGILQRICERAAEPMFNEAFSARHFQDAKKVGAIIMLQIKFKYREPGEDFQREHQMNINVPGTKVTAKMALDVAHKFIQYFENKLPVAGLDSAECVFPANGKKVFDIKFYE